MCVCVGCCEAADVECLQELQRCASRQREQEAGAPGAEIRQPMVLRYPLPYPQDPSPPPLVPQRPAELQYGNPYSTDTARGTDAALCAPSSVHCGGRVTSLSPDQVDASLSPEHMTRPPPEAPPCAPPCAPPLTPPSPGQAMQGWEREVVCIQPSRSTSPPESLEPPAEEPRDVRSAEVSHVTGYLSRMHQ